MLWFYRLSAEDDLFFPYDARSVFAALFSARLAFTALLSTSSFEVDKFRG